MGTKDNLGVKKINLKNLNLLGLKNEFDNKIFVKVRSTGKLLKSKINFHTNYAEVLLDEFEEGVSPGQACVFYSKNDLGERLLGGGWIVN